MIGLAADDLPADAVAIAAGIGIDEEAYDGMDADGLEKGAGGTAGSRMPARWTGLFIQRVQNLILLLGRGAGKLFDGRKKLADAELQAGEAFAVRFLIVDGGGGERAVDEIDDAGFAGAGRFAGGNDRRGEGGVFDACVERKEVGA